MSDPFAPAIAALQKELAALEAKARETKGAINVLCRHSGAPEMYPNLDQTAGQSSIASIKADSFYGKTIGSAAREYLDMRRQSGLGPTTSRQIYEALVQGGLQFETANPTNAMISLGNTLRKNSKVFHRLPNGQYGLLSWYPNAKSGAEDRSGERPAVANKSEAETIESIMIEPEQEPDLAEIGRKEDEDM